MDLSFIVHGLPRKRTTSVTPRASISGFAPANSGDSTEQESAPGWQPKDPRQLLPESKLKVEIQADRMPQPLQPVPHFAADGPLHPCPQPHFHQNGLPPPPVTIPMQLSPTAHVHEQRLVYYGPPTVYSDDTRGTQRQLFDQHRYSQPLPAVGVEPPAPVPPPYPPTPRPGQTASTPATSGVDENGNARLSMQALSQRMLVFPSGERGQKSGSTTRERQYACQECKRSFFRKSDLVRHIQIHLGIKPNVCHICGKKFIQRSALTVHIRVHTGEKPYMCELCGRAFSDSSSLARHRGYHARQNAAKVNVRPDATNKKGTGAQRKAYAPQTRYNARIDTRTQAATQQQPQLPPQQPNEPQKDHPYVAEQQSFPHGPYQAQPPPPQHQQVTPYSTGAGIVSHTQPAFMQPPVPNRPSVSESHPVGMLPTPVPVPVQPLTPVSPNDKLPLTSWRK